jgi:hypothetical protein
MPSESDKVQDRIDRVRSREGFTPTNETEILFALQRPSVRTDTSEFVVEDYHPTDNITAIVREDRALKSAAVSETLVDHFADEAPLEPADILICWEWGDTDELREIQRTGYLAHTVSIDFEHGCVSYDTRDGASRACDVIVVSEHLDAQSIDHTEAASSASID